jgi:hypothetical protein
MSSGITFIQVCDFSELFLGVSIKTRFVYHEDFMVRLGKSRVVQKKVNGYSLFIAVVELFTVCNSC